ncbi:MAG: hypothetical protein AB7G93_05945 [Bdellovibrionales bacterium]
MKKINCILAGTLAFLLFPLNTFGAEQLVLTIRNNPGFDTGYLKVQTGPSGELQGFIFNHEGERPRLLPLTLVNGSRGADLVKFSGTYVLAGRGLSPSAGGQLEFRFAVDYLGGQYKTCPIQLTNRNGYWALVKNGREVREATADAWRTSLNGGCYTIHGICD